MIKSSPETKHEKFQRLVEKRLEKALHEHRLIKQLSSDNYENTPEEAEQVIRQLDKSLKTVARAYTIPFRSSIAKDSNLNTSPTLVSKPSNAPVNELDVAKALDHLRNQRIEEARELLKKALLKETR